MQNTEPNNKKNILMLGLASLFNDISGQMIYPLLPLFLESVLGINKVFIGLIEGVAESTASLCRVFSGWLSDKLGRRKLLVFSGYGLSTLGKPFLYLANSGWYVLLVRFTDRFGKGIRTPARDAIIADSATVNNRGKAFGFHRTMDSLGAVLGPLLAFALLPMFDNDYRKIFLLAFIPGLLAVLVLALGVTETKHLTPPKLQNFKLTFKSLNSDFKQFCLVVALFTLGNSSDAFLILRYRQAGVPVLAIPILWLTYNLSCTLLSTPGGMLADKIGAKRTLIYGFMLYGAVYLGFAFASRTWHIWGLFILYGIYYALSEGIMPAYVAQIVPSSVRGTAYGIYHTTLGITALPASIVMGFLWQQWGFKMAFSFGAILAISAAFLLMSFHTHKDVVD